MQQRTGKRLDYVLAQIRPELELAGSSGAVASDDGASSSKKLAPAAGA